MAKYNRSTPALSFVRLTDENDVIFVVWPIFRYVFLMVVRFISIGRLIQKMPFCWRWERWCFEFFCTLIGNCRLRYGWYPQKKSKSMVAASYKTRWSCVPAQQINRWQQTHRLRITAHNSSLSPKNPGTSHTLPFTIVTFIWCREICHAVSSPSWMCFQEGMWCGWCQLCPIIQRRGGRTKKPNFSLIPYN
jgi:hypothetical protein